MFTTDGGTVPNTSNRVFGYPDSPPIVRYPPSKISVVRNPTAQNVFQDIDQWMTTTWNFAAPVNPAHGGGARARRNVMFLDAHVTLQNQRPTGGM